MGLVRLGLWIKTKDKQKKIRIRQRRSRSVHRFSFFLILIGLSLAFQPKAFAENFINDPLNGNETSNGDDHKDEPARDGSKNENSSDVSENRGNDSDFESKILSKNGLRHFKGEAWAERMLALEADLFSIVDEAKAQSVSIAHYLDQNPDRAREFFEKALEALGPSVIALPDFRENAKKLAHWIELFPELEEAILGESVRPLDLTTTRFSGKYQTYHALESRSIYSLLFFASTLKIGRMEFLFRALSHYRLYFNEKGYAVSEEWRLPGGLNFVSGVEANYFRWGTLIPEGKRRTNGQNVRHFDDWVSFLRASNDFESRHFFIDLNEVPEVARLHSAVFLGLWTRDAQLEAYIGQQTSQTSGNLRFSPWDKRLKDFFIRGENETIAKLPKSDADHVAKKHLVSLGVEWTNQVFKRKLREAPHEIVPRLMAVLTQPISRNLEAKVLWALEKLNLETLPPQYRQQIADGLFNAFLVHYAPEPQAPVNATIYLRAFRLYLKMEGKDFDVTERLVKLALQIESQGYLHESLPEQVSEESLTPRAIQEEINQAVRNRFEQRIDYAALLQAFRDEISHTSADRRIVVWRLLKKLNQFDEYFLQAGVDQLYDPLNKTSEDRLVKERSKEAYEDSIRMAILAYLKSVARHHLKEVNFHLANLLNHQPEFAPKIFKFFPRFVALTLGDRSKSDKNGESGSNPNKGSTSGDSLGACGRLHQGGS